MKITAMSSDAQALDNVFKYINNDKKLSDIAKEAYKVFFSELTEGGEFITSEKQYKDFFSDKRGMELKKELDSKIDSLTHSAEFDKRNKLGKIQSQGELNSQAKYNDDALKKYQYDAKQVKKGEKNARTKAYKEVKAKENRIKDTKAKIEKAQIDNAKVKADKSFADEIIKDSKKTTKSSAKVTDPLKELEDNLKNISKSKNVGIDVSGKAKSLLSKIKDSYKGLSLKSVGNAIKSNPITWLAEPAINEAANLLAIAETRLRGGDTSDLKVLDGVKNSFIYNIGEGIGELGYNLISKDNQLESKAIIADKIAERNAEKSRQLRENRSFLSDPETLTEQGEQYMTKMYDDEPVDTSSADKPTEGAGVNSTGDKTNEALSKVIKDKGRLFEMAEALKGDKYTTAMRDELYKDYGMEEEDTKGKYGKSGSTEKNMELRRRMQKKAEEANI